MPVDVRLVSSHTEWGVGSLFFNGSSTKTRSLGKTFSGLQICQGVNLAFKKISVHFKETKNL